MKDAASRDVVTLARALRLSPAFLAGWLEQRQGREPHNWVLDLISQSRIDRQGTLRALATSAVEMVLTDDLRLAETHAALLELEGLLAGR
jgi:hypothetical protein